jgi:hypothetical protein
MITHNKSSVFYVATPTFLVFLPTLLPVHLGAGCAGLVLTHVVGRRRKSVAKFSPNPPRAFALDISRRGFYSPMKVKQLSFTPRLI